MFLAKLLGCCVSLRNLSGGSRLRFSWLVLGTLSPSQRMRQLLGHEEGNGVSGVAILTSQAEVKLRGSGDSYVKTRFLCSE